jgi:methionyl-tRNA formyltransferase
MPLKNLKRIVLVGHDNEGSAHLFKTISEAFPEAQFLLVLGQGLYYKKTFLGSVIKLLKEASFLFVLVRFIELIRFKLTGKTMVALAREKNISIMRTSDINSEESVKQIKAFTPDLLVSLFTMQIYKQAILDVPKYGAITSHPSILPQYRGLEVFFWVLANDEKETGVSVFFISERIDAGAVIGQEIVPITREMTVASLYRTITEIGGRLLVTAMSQIDEGRTVVIPQIGKGSYYSMPDRESVRRFRNFGRKFF